MRGDPSTLLSSLIKHGEELVIGAGNARLHLRFVRSDPNGIPRVQALAKQLAFQIVHYCIPRTKLAELDGMSQAQLVPALLQMQHDAKALFTTTQATSGEGAELLLYALLEQDLGIPQVLCKMSLKTNPEVQYHGADGVHAKLLADDLLALYWGEAKLYADVAEATPRSASIASSRS